MVIPGWELWATASRSGGPGGQHANKVSTRISLHWDVNGTTALSEVQRSRVQRRLASRINSDGVLVVDADDTRSQHQNREVARTRLAELVDEALTVRPRRIRTRPSRRAKRRRVDNKKHRGRVKKLRKPPKKPPEPS